MEESEKPRLKEVVKETFMVEKEGKKKYDRRANEKNETSGKDVNVRICKNNT